MKFWVEFGCLNGNGLVNPARGICQCFLYLTRVIDHVKHKGGKSNPSDTEKRYNNSWVGRGHSGLEKSSEIGLTLLLGAGYVDSLLLPESLPLPQNL